MSPKQLPEKADISSDKPAMPLMTDCAVGRSARLSLPLTPYIAGRVRRRPIVNVDADTYYSRLFQSAGLVLR